MFDNPPIFFLYNEITQGGDSKRNKKNLIERINMKKLINKLRDLIQSFPRQVNNSFA